MAGFWIDEQVNDEMGMNTKLLKKFMCRVKA